MPNPTEAPAKRQSQFVPADGHVARRISSGPVMPIGGAEEKGHSAAILRRFVKLAGGAKANILLIPTASEDAAEAAERYYKAFVQELGANSCEPLLLADRDEANSPEIVNRLEDITGIFISGGGQARLVETLVGTVLMDAIRAANANGVIVSGTSAGASILADHLLVGGSGIGEDGSNSASPRRSMVDIGAGFGLMHDVTIDQHFSQRGRIGRLLSVFAAMPGLLAIGLDEDTAALVLPSGELEVVGSGSVTILDGRSSTSDYFDRKPGEVLTVLNSSMHVLGPGRRFDLH